MQGGANIKKLPLASAAIAPQICASLSFPSKDTENAMYAYFFCLIEFLACDRGVIFE